MFIRSIYFFRQLLTLCGIIVLFASCKKGWLNETPSSQIPSEVQFSTEGGFRDALMGVYIGMSKPSGYAKDMSWHLMDRLAILYAPYTSTTPYIDFQDFNYTSVRSRPIVDGMWDVCYNNIANINNALTNIEIKKSILDPINYNIIKGELLALRAYIHFDLIRIYGHGNFSGRPELASRLAIPYATVYGKDDPPQLTYTATFQLMEADIDMAIDLLRKDDPVYTAAQHPAGYYDRVNINGFYNNRTLRMNYYAALALKARVLSWEGASARKVVARDIANEIISNAPAHLITAASSTNKVLMGEDLFSLNIQGFSLITDLLLNASNATNYNAVFLAQAAAEELYETDNPDIGLADFRYNTLTELQVRGRVPVKLRQEGNDYISKNRMPLIRIPELYYIAAEDYIDTDLAKAIQYLNIVRQARGILQDISAGSDKQTVKDELTKEYRKEFLSEGQLFFYYKRLGFTTYPGLAADRVANDALYVLPYPANEIEFGGRIQ
ncbi:RagB/SusD family nutrient uptake outer membrane protein [Chitinophaga sp. MM2321]|uniref:RagB/SusD family nutrient uptake outer membrane protein n=1 Tax=Chitinophaga sp. MM2321 TaxID=3137178 RepID=UPI0032D58C87